MRKLLTLFCKAFVLITVLTFFQSKAAAQNIELDYRFHEGELGWTAGFADYPPANEPIYELEARIRLMPRKLTYVPKRGFYIQGHNRSDDLFMFLKRRLTTKAGITPNQTYRVEYIVTFASNAASGCPGSGGSPGDDVTLKVGASSIEPLAVLQPDGYLRMNIDKGDQSTGGTEASVAGNIANGIPCAQAFPIFPFAMVQRSHQHPFNVTAGANGELWLLVGTDSGFEGLTRLYYQNIKVRLIPV